MFVLLALLLSTPPSQQPAAPAAPTAVSADVAGQVNPVKPTAVSQAFAKKMYGYDCAMCHGANGNGKGDLAVEQKLSLKDYTEPAALKGMSGGRLFSIIKNGKGQMTAEGDRLKTDDLWNMVILLRSFSKK